MDIFFLFSNVKSIGNFIKIRKMLEKRAIIEKKCSKALAN